MTDSNCWTLALTTAIVAGLLLLEHEFTGKRDWPRQVCYAEGLTTVLGGLLIWAAVVQVRVTWETAGAMMLAGMASGVPTFLLLWQEERKRQQAWAALERSNAELASQLRCLLSKQVNSRYMRRLREMVETAAFATVAMRQEREMIELAERQQKELLAQIRTIVGESQQNVKGDENV